jgi:hypothetical protein
MPSTHRRRSRRALTPAGVPLRGPVAALDVVLAAASQPLTDETIAVVLDHAHRGMAVFTVTGAATPEGVSSVARVLAELARRGSGIGAAVLATMRAGGGAEPNDGDHFCFLDLRAQLDLAGVELLDWFLLDGRCAASMAEVTDAQCRWLDPRA